MKAKIEGSCLCGIVTFSLRNEFSKFHLCHCVQCRKITGSAHASNLFTDPDNIEWMSGEDKVCRYESSAGDFTKAFCSHCGSGLPFVSQSGESLIVPAGSLDDDPDMQPQDNIFWSERATWYEAGSAAYHYEGFPE